MKLEYCCGPIICVTGRGLCIAVQYSQNACFIRRLEFEQKARAFNILYRIKDKGLDNA